MEMIEGEPEQEKNTRSQTNQEVPRYMVQTPGFD